MVVDPEKVVDRLISIFASVPEIYEENDREVERRDYEHSDLTHVVELTSFGGVQGFKLAKQIQENRQKRREAKDQNFIMRPLYEFIKRNPSLLTQLQKVHADTVKQIKANRERRYHPRSDNEIVLEAIERLNESREL